MPFFITKYSNFVVIFQKYMQKNHNENKKND